MSTTANEHLAAAKAAVEERMAALNAAWQSSPRDGVVAEAAAAWPEGAWVGEAFACAPGELSADAWLEQLADQGYVRTQHLDSLEPDVGWTPPDDGSPGGGESPSGDVYLVHGTFTNGGKEAKGEAHWVVEGGTAHWLASRCISP